jgi:ABC-type transport system substrate-binding protein
MLRTGGRQNYGQYSDPETDRLLDLARHSSDPKRWADSLAKVEARYRETLPSIPLLFRNAVSVRPRDLEGWAPPGTITPVTWCAELWRWK